MAENGVGQAECEDLRAEIQQATVGGRVSKRHLPNRRAVCFPSAGIKWSKDLRLASPAVNVTVGVENEPLSS
ncbi:hypothetical protein Kisp01_42090 [Kineosporia sp. NBRC 101677]|nr:hypothetical protein Kisp01_42090 [Kineosporia sp. NBRC 101677]